MYSGDDLIRIRQEHKLTQDELADKLRLSRELIVKMEGGKRPISKATEILLDHFESEHKREKSTIKKDNTKMQQDYIIERLIKSLDDQIEVLKKSNALLEQTNKALNDRVNLLSETVLPSLDVALKNLVTHHASAEARQEMMLRLLSKLTDNDYTKILDTVYNDEVEKMLDYTDKDTVLKIGSHNKR